jgi:hypothetical protein
MGPTFFSSNQAGFCFHFHFNGLQVGPGNFGASAHYIHHFSSKSQCQITGKVGRYINHLIPQ